MRKDKGRIQNPHQPSQGKKIKLDKTEVTNHKHPIFCIRYLHHDYNIGKCTEDEKLSFLDRLVILSSMEWSQIDVAPRHGLGSENIPRKSLRQQLPEFITDDVTHLRAFRFQGKKPFLGHRDRFIFHVFFIDRDFTLYDHG